MKASQRIRLQMKAALGILQLAVAESHLKVGCVYEACFNAETKGSAKSFAVKKQVWQIEHVCA